MITVVKAYDVPLAALFLDKDKKMRSFVSRVIGGDVEKFIEIVEAQCGGETILRSLRSRYALHFVCKYRTMF